MGRAAVSQRKHVEFQQSWLELWLVLWLVTQAGAYEWPLRREAGSRTFKLTLFSHQSSSYSVESTFQTWVFGSRDSASLSLAPDPTC